MWKFCAVMIKSCINILKHEINKKTATDPYSPTQGKSKICDQDNAHFSLSKELVHQTKFIIADNFNTVRTNL